MGRSLLAVVDQKLRRVMLGVSLLVAGLVVALLHFRMRSCESCGMYQFLLVMGAAVAFSAGARKFGLPVGAWVGSFLLAFGVGYGAMLLA